MSVYNGVHIANKHSCGPPPAHPPLISRYQHRLLRDPLAAPKAQRHARHASQAAQAAREAAHAWQQVGASVGHGEDAASLGYMLMGI